MVSPDSAVARNRGSSILLEAKSGDTTPMFHAYILRLADGSYYIGSSGELSDRMDEHRKGRVKSTRNKLPCELVYKESFENRSKAQSREYQIKKWKSRSAIERLLKNKK